MLKVDENSSSSEQNDTSSWNELPEDKESSKSNKKVDENQKNEYDKDLSVDSKFSDYSDLAVHPLQSSITVKYNHKPQHVSKLLNKHFTTPTRTRTNIVIFRFIV